MAKNILIINGSPRAHGNTEALVDAFIEGAQGAGHTTAKMNLRQMNVKPCIGCCKCVEKKGDPCIQKDDMKEIYAAYAKADTLVFAAPMYFWTFPAQLKAALDRIFAPSAAADMKIPATDCVMLMPAGGTGPANAEPAVSYYKSLLSHMGWSDRGIIMAEGVNDIGDIQKTSYPEEARKLGASL